MTRTRILYARQTDSAIIRPFFQNERIKTWYDYYLPIIVSQTSSQYSNEDSVSIFWMCWSLTTLQPLWVILCRLPEKGRKEIEETVGETKERDREERGTGMKAKKQKKQKHFPSILTCYKDSRPCPTVSQYQLDACVHFNLLSKIKEFSNPWHRSEHFLRWGGAYPLGTHSQCQWMHLIIRNSNTYSLGVGIRTVSEILNFMWTGGGGAYPGGSWIECVLS